MMSYSFRHSAFIELASEPAQLRQANHYPLVLQEALTNLIRRQFNRIGTPKAEQ
jgi:hypothetical protein